MAAALSAASPAQAAIETTGGFVFYFGMLFLILLVQGAVVGFILSALRRRAQKLRYAMSFAWASALLLACAFPFVGWNPVILLGLAVVAFVVTEFVNPEGPAPAATSPIAPDESV